MALRILLADDSMTAQNIGKKILSAAGYEVIAVSNGCVAIKKLEETAPELAVLDVYMPGYSGLEVSEKIKSAPATAHIPVLLTVGKLEPFRQEDGIRAKADGVVIKPFEAVDFLSVVAQLAERVYARGAAGDHAAPPSPNPARLPEAVAEPAAAPPVLSAPPAPSVASVPPAPPVLSISPALSAPPAVPVHEAAPPVPEAPSRAETEAVPAMWEVPFAAQELDHPEPGAPLAAEIQADVEAQTVELVSEPMPAFEIQFEPRAESITVPSIAEPVAPFNEISVPQASPELVESPAPQAQPELAESPVPRIVPEFVESSAPSAVPEAPGLEMIPQPEELPASPEAVPDEPPEGVTNLTLFESDLESQEDFQNVPEEDLPVEFDMTPAAFASDEPPAPSASFSAALFSAPLSQPEREVAPAWSESVGFVAKEPEAKEEKVEAKEEVAEPKQEQEAKVLPFLMAEERAPEKPNTAANLPAPGFSAPSFSAPEPVVALPGIGLRAFDLPAAHAPAVEPPVVEPVIAESAAADSGATSGDGLPAAECVECEDRSNDLAKLRGDFQIGIPSLYWPEPKASVSAGGSNGSGGHVEEAEPEETGLEELDRLVCQSEAACQDDAVISSCEGEEAEPAEGPEELEELEELSLESVILPAPVEEPICRPSGVPPASFSEAFDPGDVLLEMDAEEIVGRLLDRLRPELVAEVKQLLASR